MSARATKVAPRMPMPAFGGMASVAVEAVDRLGRGLDEAFEMHETWMLALEARVDVLGRLCTDLERDVLRLRADLEKRTRKIPGPGRKHDKKESK